MRNGEIWRLVGRITEMHFAIVIVTMVTVKVTSVYIVLMVVHADAGIAKLGLSYFQAGRHTRRLNLGLFFRSLHTPMWFIATDIARSVVCLSVCWSHGRALQRPAEPITMAFEGIDPRNHVLVGGWDPLSAVEGAIVRPSEKHWESQIQFVQQKKIVQSSVTAQRVMPPFVKIHLPRVKFVLYYHSVYSCMSGFVVLGLISSIPC